MRFLSLNSLSSFVCVLGLAVVVTSSAQSNDMSDEDKYVKQFGNKENNTNEWYTIKQWWSDEDQLRVKKLCAGAHRKMFGKGRHMIESLAYKNATLSFTSSKYRPMRVFYLEYGLRCKDIPKDVIDYLNVNENDRWYLTQGLHKGCVFYLALVNSTSMEFNLEKHVCGLKHKYV